MRSAWVVALVLGACTGSVKPGTPLSDSGDRGSDAEAGTTSDSGAGDRGDAALAEPDDAGSGGEDEAGGEDARADPVEDASGDENGEDAATEPEADSGSADTGTPAQPDTGVPDTGMVEPTPGTVPLFVAVGYGTRRIVSCDYGLTWKNDESDIANGGDDGYLARGLAAGEGKFVAAVGGGGVQMLMTSDDGVAWNRIMRNGNGFSDATYGNGLFVAGGGHSSLTSQDGLMWDDATSSMGGDGIVRHLAFGDYMGGRFVGVGDRGRRVNSRDGVAWDNNIEGGDTLRGVDYGNGVFVAITGGATTRYSENGGDSWSDGSISGASDVRGILFDGSRFIVTTRSNSYTSSDGKSWTSHNATGGPESFDVSDDGEHYAGSYGDVLYHSTDGVRFSVVKMSGQAFTRVKFQRVKPSSVCPG